MDRWVAFVEVEGQEIYQSQPLISRECARNEADEMARYRKSQGHMIKRVFIRRAEG